MNTTKYNITKSIIKELILIGFRALKTASELLRFNLIDNYGYREYTTVEILESFLPSIKKTIGRSGDDANAVNEGYHHIELKSGSTQGKTLTMASFPKMMFDKQSDPARREYIYKYDGLGLSIFEYFNPYPTAIVFVPKDQVAKLHPLFKKKQDIKVEDFAKRLAEGKNIGHDPIVISLQEIVDAVGEENLICWLRNSRISSTDFFYKINNNEIKINQNDNDNNI